MRYDVRITSQCPGQFDYDLEGREVASYSKLTVGELDLIMNAFKAIGGSIEITTILDPDPQEE